MKIKWNHKFYDILLRQIPRPAVSDYLEKDRKRKEEIRNNIRKDQ
jgi:hypothetical protein